jgi:nicotinate-nucleotide adenylyltransferase
MKTLSIGLLGGIFDPLHHGHLAAARLTLDFCKLDFVYLVPAGVPPHKIGAVLGSAGQRLAMVRRALKTEKLLKIWDREIKSRRVSYTVDTIAQVRRAHPGAKLFFIIGQDNVREITGWKDYKQILRQVTLCVVARPGFRGGLPAQLKNTRMLEIPSPQWGLSSSLLRSSLARGLSCRYCIPDAVLDYIKTHKLYRKTKK